MPSSRSQSQAQYSLKALEIIQRTNELLAKGGYNGFSYADIAALVDVRKASIHHHFPAKADLVKATVAVHREATRHGLQSLSLLDIDPLERLVAYSRFWAECIQASNPPICICALLAAELPSIPAEVADEVKAHFNDLHAWIASSMEEGQAKGAMRLSDSPSAEASMFMASIHGAMLSARAVGDASVFWQIAKLATDRLRKA
ncbi:transcriptional regulator, TetR family [Lysobacter capsici]|jgi:TetR/AcrR family transcriptional repressor of nem operon|uniref:TetR/AcrR family transcriptional regulator n=1 Tax=Lysobacter capsici TaxID=435897 RepID=UPI0007167523|nr:TetR/AcrR family transcriptional regulator [Lysobacter capsici]ALN88782.1 transcriptional regulator, TetR family [Lysobacter capsici]WND80615.1 TetR/AcrR family transcriptional regulator [Lysobacter capsici]WND85811.1 TetR/AcrR family transcriptional regulator [Lysobacter capsici]